MKRVGQAAAIALATLLTPHAANSDCCAPITGDPADCPNRVPVPVYKTPDYGCGPDNWVISEVIQFFNSRWSRGADLTPACVQHDKCYHDCSSSKAGCDAEFKKDAENICRKTYPLAEDRLKLHYCFQAAHADATVVGFAKAAYDADQRTACQCCPPPCGGTCCNPDKEVCCNLYGGVHVCRSKTASNGICSVCDIACADHKTCCAGSAFKSCCLKADHKYKCIVEPPPDGSCG